MFKGLKQGQCERNKALKRYDNRAMGVIVSTGTSRAAQSSATAAQRTTWTMPASRVMEAGSPTCAEAGNLGGVVLFGQCVEVHREQWLQPEISKQMCCICSSSPIWISPIQKAWTMPRKIKASGNVMVQMLRLPIDVLDECMPEVDLKKLILLQQEYERSVIETQEKKIAATKTLLRRLCGCSSVTGPNPSVALEDKMVSQEQRLRHLLSQRPTCRRTLTEWVAKTYPQWGDCGIGIQ